MESLSRLLPLLSGGSPADLAFLLVASALPLCLLWALLAFIRPAFVPRALLAAAGLGVLTLLPALGFSLLLARLPIGGLAATLRTLLATPFSEELARTVVFAIALVPVARLERTDGEALKDGALLAALAAGMAFSALETAMQAATAPFALILRSALTWPVHGACAVFTARAVLGAPAFLALSVLVHAAFNASLGMKTLFVSFLLSLGCFLFALLAVKKRR